MDGVGTRPTLLLLVALRVVEGVGLASAMRVSNAAPTATVAAPAAANRRNRRRGITSSPTHSSHIGVSFGWDSTRDQVDRVVGATALVMVMPRSTAQRLWREPDPNRYDLLNRSGQRRPVRHLAVHRLRGAKQMRTQPQTGPPAPQGLYDPRFEHDACGVSFVANLKGQASRSIVAMGLGALCNLQHRGATGAEADTGDGAGILIQVPDRFLREPSSTSTCRRLAPTRSALRFCRSTRPTPRRPRRSSRRSSSTRV